MDAGSIPVVVEPDYCTLFPDEIAGVSLRSCCFAHDVAYATGVPKLEADLSLARCVAAQGLPATAVVMFLGVTLFGWLFYRKRK